MSLATAQSVQWARITSANGVLSMATYMNAARIGRCLIAGIEVRMQSYIRPISSRALALHGPDEYPLRKAHLLKGLEVQVTIQAYFLTVRPICHHQCCTRSIGLAIPPVG